MKPLTIGMTIPFGQYLWRILDIKGQNALLITDSIVTQQPFHNTFGEVTWATSHIRQYLNTTFFMTFSASEREQIQPVGLKNNDNPWYGSKGGEDTFDHVFLLSLEEAVCHHFGDSRMNLENRSEKQRYWFQKKDPNNIKRRAKLDDAVWWWWLRTSGRDNKRAVYIHGDGNVGIQGNGTFRYNSNTIHPLTGDNSGGVRPALWVKLNS